MQKRILFCLTIIGAISLLFLILGYSLHFADSFKPSNAPKSDTEDINPTDVDALFNKAYDLDEQGKYQEAITWYDKVLAIDPTDVDALNNKAFALAKLSKNEEGLALIEKAIETAPDNTYYLGTAAFIMNNLGKYDQPKTIMIKC